IGMILAGCQHSSEKKSVSTTSPEVASGTSSSSPSPETTSSSTASSSTASSQKTPLTPTQKTDLYGLKGLGFNTAAGTSLTPVALNGQMKSLNGADLLITGREALVSLSYAGDDTLKGSLVTTGRSDRGAAYDNDTRFLMSDQSVASKDAPTSFGLLIDKSSSTGLAAGALYGGKTPTNIPGSGAASYRGKFAGVANAGTGASGSQAHLSGNFNLSADFGAGTIKGDIDQISSVQRDASKSVGSLDSIGFVGKMSGNKAAYTATTVTVTGAGLGSATGRAEGGFYNAGASETAGVLRTTVAGTSPTAIVGAFQGKKQP
ncbi:MAG: transferrin-binding protein-like solute binding protein, partial [Phyllobacterium sp.]